MIYTRPARKKGRSILIANEAFWFGALIIGSFVTFAGLQVLEAKQIEKNNPVKVVTFRNGQYAALARSASVRACIAKISASANPLAPTKNTAAVSLRLYFFKRISCTGIVGLTLIAMTLWLCYRYKN